MAQVPPPQSNYPRPNMYSGGVAPGEIVLDFDVSRVWRIVIDNSSAFVPSMIVGGILFYAWSFAVTLGVNSLLFGSALAVNVSLSQSLGAMAIQQVLNSVLAGLTAGMSVIALRAVRGETTGIGDLFSPYRKFLPVTAAYFLSVLLTLAGMVCLILPGLVIGALAQWIYLYVVDQGLSPVEAARAIRDDFRGQYGLALAYIFVFGLLSGLGVIFCGFGILITYPMFPVALALAYNAKYGTNTFVATQIGEAPPM